MLDNLHKTMLHELCKCMVRTDVGGSGLNPISGTVKEVQNSSSSDHARECCSDVCPLGEKASVLHNRGRIALYPDHVCTGYLFCCKTLGFQWEYATGSYSCSNVCRYLYVYRRYVPPMVQRPLLCIENDWRRNQYSLLFDPFWDGEH